MAKVGDFELARDISAAGRYTMTSVSTPCNQNQLNPPNEKLIIITVATIILPYQTGEFRDRQTDSCFVVVRFSNHSYGHRPNRTPLSLITIINYGLVSKFMIMLTTIIKTVTVTITLNFTGNNDYKLSYISTSKKNSLAINECIFPFHRSSASQFQRALPALQTVACVDRNGLHSFSFIVLVQEC